ncbi:hypothetical protein DP190_07085 [Enterobacter cloacae]|nr:hypothetical protein DP190_07085 [Enterobacter cloacae]
MRNVMAFLKIKYNLYPLFIFLVIFFGYSHHASAVTGWCTPTGGTPYHFDIDFTSTITDPSLDSPGKIIDPVDSWDLGTTYSITCDCDGTNRARMFSGRSTLTQYGVFNSKAYYNLNDNMAIATTIFVGGNGYYTVPFENISNNSPDKACNTPINTANSGSKGNVSLYIKKGFVGSIDIPSTLVASMYSTKATGSYSSTPISQVYISGTISVPQSCKINDGQIIDIDLGRLVDTSLKTKGAKPDGYEEKTASVNYSCTNIAEGIKVKFSFNGQAAPGDSSSLLTTNSDIGVRIEDRNGAIVSPNSGDLLTQFDASTQTGNALFKSYPVNVSGNMPVPGKFTATATVMMNLE